MCLLRLTERSPRKKSDLVLLAIINNKVRLPISEAIAVLHGDNRYDCAGPLHMFTRYIRERDMADLTLLAQSGQCFYRRLERHGIVGSVQLIDVDTVQPQPLQTPLKCFRKMFRAGIVRPLARSRALPSTFGRNHQSI